ncbi:hypothetical protein [Xanthobacter sp. YC-JY1]|uniref:hypothetical protein n=1 Tax=Xanthobacter sp. YC-JY1 TaxID=2419844 RepID=UPI001F2EEE4B|nr:hypothetical protein [Xanthobacter sp. YC-JY1]
MGGRDHNLPQGNGAVVLESQTGKSGNIEQEDNRTRIVAAAGVDPEWRVIDDEMLGSLQQHHHDEFRPNLINRCVGCAIWLPVDGSDEQMLWDIHSQDRTLEFLRFKTCSSRCPHAVFAKIFSARATTTDVDA